MQKFPWLHAAVSAINCIWHTRKRKSFNMKNLSWAKKKTFELLWKCKCLSKTIIPFRYGAKYAISRLKAKGRKVRPASVLASQRELSSSSGLPHLETAGFWGSFGSLMISDLGILSLVFLNSFSISILLTQSRLGSHYIKVIGRRVFASFASFSSLVLYFRVSDCFVAPHAMLLCLD